MQPKDLLVACDASNILQSTCYRMKKNESGDKIAAKQIYFP